MIQKIKSSHMSSVCFRKRTWCSF